MDRKPMPSGLERRREDYPLITGHTHYVDDLRAEPGRPSILHMVVVLSPYAHAEVQAIDLEAARALPGVVAALAASELDEAMPTMESIPVPHKRNKPSRKPLATQRDVMSATHHIVVNGVNPNCGKKIRSNGP